MKKKIIVAAIAAAMVAPMAAMADATVYGKVRVATQYHDRDDSILDIDNRGDSWGLQDQTSRLGIKGSEDLGNGLKAIYQMEFGVDVGNGFGNKIPGGSNANFWSQRNSYIGLAGGWGTFLAGRHDTPFKMSSGKLDFFQDTAADYDVRPGPKGTGLFHSLRLDGTLAYISPNFSGFTFAGAIIQTGTAPNIDTFVNDNADDFVSGWSVAGMFNQGPWFASLAYESLDPESLGILVQGDDDTKWRVGLGVLDWSGFSAAFIYESRTQGVFDDGFPVDDLGILLPDNEYDSWQLQAAYDFGNNRVKGMYGDRNNDNPYPDWSTWAIGYQYNFSKRTDVEVLYRDLNGDDLLPDDSVFAVQLNHAF